MLLNLVLPVYAGTIERSGGNFATHDEIAEGTKLNTQVETLYTEFNKINHENIQDEGIRNADLDSNEVFTKESWNNALSSGHFPLWEIWQTTGGGAACVAAPDNWTLELTPTIDKGTGVDKPTGAPANFYGCKITATAAALEGIYQTFDCRASQTYSIMLKVKCTAGDVARVSITDNGSMADVTYDYSDTSWQTENNKKYFTFTTASDSTTVTVKLLAKESGDIVWFGEVQVTEGRLEKGYQYQNTNADTVDNIHASATATANKLVALDADARLPYAAMAIKALEAFEGDSSGGYVDIDDSGSKTSFTITLSSACDVFVTGTVGMSINNGPPSVINGTIRLMYGATPFGQWSVGIGSTYPGTTYDWKSATDNNTFATGAYIDSLAAGTYTFKAQMASPAATDAFSRVALQFYFVPE